MIHFFGDLKDKVFAVQSIEALSEETISKLTWLFGNQPKIEQASLDAFLGLHTSVFDQGESYHMLVATLQMVSGNGFDIQGFKYLEKVEATSVLLS